jgi:hypothetical protein
MHDSTRSFGRKVESPSAILKGFSNTPQPKPDRRPSPIVGHHEQLSRVFLNLASQAGLMKSQNSPAKRTPHFLHPQHLTISQQAKREGLERGLIIESSAGQTTYLILTKKAFAAFGMEDPMNGRCLSNMPSMWGPSASC